MIITLTGLLIASLLSAGDAIELPENVRTSIERRIEHGMNAGIVVGIVAERDGKLETEYWSFGVMKAGERAKVGPDTIFEIGSITKAFTGILLADAVERSEAKLDDPIDKFLPEGVTAPTRSGKKIMLEHLATHRSGLPRLPDNLMPTDDADPYADYSAKLLHEFLSSHELQRDIGAQYEYSNLGAGLLGHLLSLSAEKSYEDLVVERICKPLKMKDTRLTLSRSQQKRFANGHVGMDPVAHWTMRDCLVACGALRSTAKDMTRFLAANMKAIDSPLTNAMGLARTIRRDAGSGEVHVGLGWHINTRFDTTVVWHNGGTGGFRSFCGFVPDRKRGVVVLSNTSNSVDDIGFNLLESQYELEEIPQKVKVSKKVLAEYAGFYELQPGFVFDITAKDGRLFAKLTGQQQLEVFPESETVFFYTAVDAKLIFERDASGKVHQLRLDQFGMKRPAKKLANYTPPTPRVEVPVDRKILKRYEGKYQLVPGVVFDVRLQGDQLTAHITGQSRLPIYPESETKFFYKAVDAQITFVMGDKEVAGKLILHQSGLDRPANRIE